MFGALLNHVDAERASRVVRAMLAHGLRGALAGGLAVAAQLRAHARPFSPRRLNDVDLVVQGFDAIPESIAESFLLHHVHPTAEEGKTLLQVIDPRLAVRVDLFRAFGFTLSRTVLFDDLHPLPVLSVEDLVARATAMLRIQLGRGSSVDPKHVEIFATLSDLGEPRRLQTAWNDHRQGLRGTLEEARQATVELLKTRSDLLVADKYSAVAVPCSRCRQHGPFRPAAPDKIIQALGYW